MEDGGWVVGKKRVLINKLMASQWKGTKEKDAWLLELRECGARAGDVLELVTHSDQDVQAHAARVFVATCNATNVVQLLDRLQTEKQRSLVYALFPRIDASIMDEVMEELLRSHTDQHNKLAWDIVPKLGVELRVRYLQKAIHRAPPAMRPQLLRQLLREETPGRLVPLLVECAKSDDPQLCKLAMEGCAGLLDPRVAEMMVDRFAYGNNAAREMAYGYLNRTGPKKPTLIRPPMLKLLAAGQDEIRRLGVTILLNTGPAEEVLPEILLFVRDLIGWLRRRILDTLLTFGDQVLVPVLTLLNHPDAQVRSAALTVAERFNDPRLLEPTVMLLRDDDWWLRVLACEMLGRLGDRRGIPSLVQALRDDNARWAAIDALGQIGAPEAIRHLLPLLKDPRAEVRMEVLGVLSSFNDASLFEIVTKVLARDPSNDVRTRASEVAQEMAEKLSINVRPDELLPAPPPARNHNPLEKMLIKVRKRGASDLHITVDEPPFIRVNGALVRLDGVGALNSTHTQRAVRSLLSKTQQAALEKNGEIDFCHAIPEVGRYRGNAFKQRRGVCAVFRVIPSVPPTFEDLRLPDTLREIRDMNQGLVVVSGPAGSGKSTTMAAIINLLNETRSVHIITLEDPIEVVHPPKKALVDQREVGTHTQSFTRALRAALREDPDVIMIGEMRDAETMRMALTAAETGHLVVATMHTNRAIDTIDRLVDSFRPEEQSQMRQTLADTLKLVVAQRLMPRADQPGRVGVYEVLRVVQSVAGLIREGKAQQIRNAMVMGQRAGMQTLDTALTDLVKDALIAPQEAYLRADIPADFTKYLATHELAELSQAEEHHEPSN